MKVALIVALVTALGCKQAEKTKPEVKPEPAPEVTDEPTGVIEPTPAPPRPDTVTDQHMATAPRARLLTSGWASTRRARSTWSGS